MWTVKYRNNRCNNMLTGLKLLSLKIQTIWLESLPAGGCIQDFPKSPYRPKW